MIAIRVTTEKVLDVIEIEPPVYKGLHELFGDYFEIVRPRGLKPQFVMIVDESGLLKELPINIVGSVLYGTHSHGQPIAGDIVIMREKHNFDGADLASLEGADVSELIALLNDIASRYFVM